MAITKNLNFKPLVIGGAVFALWAYATFSGALAEFDRWGLLLFRTADGGQSVPLGPDGTPEVVTALTHLGDTITLLLVSVALLAWLLLRGARYQAAYTAAAITGVFLISPVFKFLFDRDRPDIVEQFVHASSKSFPSGHALRSAGIYLIIYVVLAGYLSNTAKRLLFIATSAVILLTGVSRVYLGVHWPSDIVASWIIAVSWLFFCKTALMLRPS